MCAHLRFRHVQSPFFLKAVASSAEATMLDPNAVGPHFYTPDRLFASFLHLMSQFLRLPSSAFHLTPLVILSCLILSEQLSTGVDVDIFPDSGESAFACKKLGVWRSTLLVRHLSPPSDMRIGDIDSTLAFMTRRSNKYYSPQWLGRLS